MGLSKLLPAGAGNNTDESHKTEPKFLFCKIKTVSSQMLKHSVELRGPADLEIILCGFVINSDPFRVIHSHLSHC